PVSDHRARRATDPCDRRGTPSSPRRALVPDRGAVSPAPLPTLPGVLSLERALEQWAQTQASAQVGKRRNLQLSEAFEAEGARRNNVVAVSIGGDDDWAPRQALPSEGRPASLAPVRRVALRLP